MAKNAELVEAKKSANKEQLEEEVAKAKNNLDSLKARIETKKGEIKGKASADFEKLQDSLNSVKEKIEDKKEVINKERMEIYIDDMADYAAACLELAFRVAEEAQLATLEAILVQKEYDEKYGE